MSLTAIIVEDGAQTGGEFHRSCLRDGRIDVLGTVPSVHDAFEAAVSRTPDVVFVDLDLHELDSPWLTHTLRELDQAPEIVFGTSSAHLAITAFDLAVTDCVLKPIRTERFTQTVDRVSEAVRRRRKGEPTRLEELWLPKLGTMVRVPISSIERIEAERDYARVWTPGGSFLLRTTMASMERKLASTDFVRIHRSTIVAVNQIRGCRHVGGGAWAVVDALGDCHSVGRRHLAAVRERLGVDWSEEAPVPMPS